MSTATRFTTAHLLVPLALLGCSEEALKFPAAQHVDSAGVEIVSIGSLGDLPERSAVRILSLPDRAASEFLYDVRGVTWVDSQRIAILNGGAHEIAWYARSGRRLARAGSHGEGPGEFLNPVAIWPMPGGGVAVLDAGTARQVHYLDGEFLSDRRIRPLPSSAALATVGRATDGILLVENMVRVPAEIAIGGGEGRDSTTLFLYHVAEGETRAIRSFPGLEYLSEGGGSWTAIYPERDATFAGRDTLLVWLPADEYGMHLMSQGGGLLKIVRASRLPADSDDESSGQPKLFVDNDKRIWSTGIFGHLLPEAAASADSSPWVVLSPDGLPHFWVGLPDRFTPYDMNSAVVLGVTRDSLGVETVEGYLIQTDPFPDES